MMRGPVVLSYMWEDTEKQTKILEDGFLQGFLCWQFTTLVKYSRHTLSLFGANIGYGHHLGG